MRSGAARKVLAADADPLAAVDGMDAERTARIAEVLDYGG